MRTVGVLACVLLLAAGAAVWWLRVGPGHHDRILIVGDSITELSAGELSASVPDGPEVSGVAGARADQRVADAQALLAAPRDQVVVDLGTNDVMQDWPPDQTIAALEQIGVLAEGSAGARCIDLVTVNEGIVSFEDPDVSARAARLNVAIRDLAGRHGWRVIPWDRVVADYTAAGSPEGPVTSDTVHPTEVGQRLLAGAITEAVDAC